MRLVCLFLVLCGCASPRKTPVSEVPVPEARAAPEPIVRKRFRLAPEDFWRLELPDGKPFDASGLVFDSDGLLTVSDEAPGLFRIVFGDNHAAELKPVEIFTREQLMAAAPEMSRSDLEGIARDEAGRIYICEESRRLVFRFDPATKKAERLPIDWNPVQKYFNGGANASFEGIAVAGDKLWVANERDQSRVIEIDLPTLKITGDFRPLPSSFAFFLHYSDLAWHDGKLFVLLRHQQEIIELDPRSREVTAEYSYASLEEALEHRYVKEYPTGTMEGLAVDAEFFWLVTDNNGFPRKQDGRDRRPTLFKCPRPK